MGVADATIVNLYYANLAPAIRFWRDGLGFPVAVDQGWAVLLRLAAGSFLGLVDGARGHLRPQPASAVLVTLVVEDLSAWRARVDEAGALEITAIEQRDDLGGRAVLLPRPRGLRTGVPAVPTPRRPPHVPRGIRRAVQSLRSLRPRSTGAPSTQVDARNKI